VPNFLQKVIDFYLSNREEKSVLHLHEGIVDGKQLDSLLESDASPTTVGRHRQIAGNPLEL